jgi:hypothetical protein
MRARGTCHWCGRPDVDLDASLSGHAGEPVGLCCAVVEWIRQEDEQADLERALPARAVAYPSWTMEVV